MALKLEVIADPKLAAATPQPRPLQLWLRTDGNGDVCLTANGHLFEGHDLTLLRIRNDGSSRLGMCLPDTLGLMKDSAGRLACYK